MFARATRGSVPADKLDDAIARFQSRVLPSFATQPGYLGGVLLADRGTGAVRAITYWQDEAALNASEAMAAASRAEAAQTSGGRVEEPEPYEVVLHERVVAPRPNVFVRINDVRGSIEHIEDVLAFSREQVLPALRSQRGWLAMQAMVNRQNGRSLLITVWDSAADREGSEAAIRLLREQGGATAGASTVDVSLYECVVLDLKPAAFPVGAASTPA
jgi:heme-degrading monooxygenase HmoA